MTLTTFQRAYPKTTFVEINAAVSGTGSDYGAPRLQRDVLRHRPDLLFVEFAVNDGAGSDAGTDFGAGDFTSPNTGANASMENASLSASP